jgi:dihydroneopterin aldolase
MTTHSPVQKKKKENEAAGTALITIEGLSVDCVIGVYPEEKIVTQPLLVDLALVVDVTGAVKTDNLPDALDYAGIALDVSFILQNGKFQLLESAAACVASFLLAPLHPTQKVGVSEVEVTIRKPQALRAHGAVAAVGMKRRADDTSYEWRRSTLGEVMTIFTNDRMTLLALKLPALGQTPRYTHALAHCVEKPVGCTSGLWLSEGEEPHGERGTAMFSPGVRRSYRNTKGEPAILLTLVSCAGGEEEFLC